MLGTLAGVWGVALGVGVAIDYFFIRTSARVKTHRCLRYYWIKLRRCSVPDLSKFVANGVIRAVGYRITIKNLSKKSQINFSRFQSVLYLATTSFVLTYCALVVDDLINVWRKLNKKNELLGNIKDPSILDVLQTSVLTINDVLASTALTPFGVKVYILSGCIFLLNLIFDALTILITLHILKIIVIIKNDISRIILIFLDLICAMILVFAVAEFLDIVANYIYLGILPISWEYFYEGNVIGILKAGLWVFANIGSADSSTDFLYSSTTLIPTAVFLFLMLVSIIAKPVAHLGQWLAIHVLGVTSERRPELLPVGVMLGALVAFMTTIWVALSRASSQLAAVIASWGLN